MLCDFVVVVHKRFWRFVSENICSYEVLTLALYNTNNVNVFTFTLQNIVFYTILFQAGIKYFCFVQDGPKVSCKVFKSLPKF